MKKLYSLFATVVMAVAVNAQGTENFDTRTNTAGSGYTTVSFSGADNTSWSLAAARIISTAADFNITNRSVILRGDGSGGTATITFPNGVGALTYQYRKAFTGAAARKMQVKVDGETVDTTAEFGSGTGAQTDIYTHTIEINKSGNVVVEVAALGAQVTVDNFSWTVPTLSAIDFDKTKKSLIKNTSVQNELIFATKSDIKIFNSNGQVVKSAAVNENTVLNVSELPKGVYVVSGNIDGNAVSQKFMKK